MNRCIHCTRCVRFANEVAGALEMGTTGRGNEMQIGTYIQHAVNTEMSGNIVDLCPVGALTSKPYAFTSRPWELKNTESIDVLDAVGSNIRVCSRGLEIMRILPRVNEDVNEEWINDKTRYAYDGLKRQRLTTPMMRKGSGFVPCSWSEAFSMISNALSNTKPENMTAVAGQLADVESLVSLKDLFNKMGSENLRLDTQTYQPPSGLADISSNYLFNSTINSVEEADWILLVGTNPRHEAAIINTRIRKAFLHYQVDIGILGHTSDLNYEFTHLGNSVADIRNLKGDNAFYKKLATAKNPMVIIGSSVYERRDAGAVMADISKFVDKYKHKFVRDDWTGFNVLQRFASHAGAYEVGFVSNTPPPKKTDFLYLLNADDVKADDIDADAFVVYQGHHGDIGAAYANVILPGSAYTEKTATYINTEGRTQTTRAAVSPPGAAREDWKIIRALSEVVGHQLPYDSISDLRHRMQDVSPSLVHYDGVLPHLFVEESVGYYTGLKGSVDESVELTTPIKDFYMTDCISRASKTMAKCSQSFTYNAGYGADKRIAV